MNPLKFLFSDEIFQANTFQRSAYLSMLYNCKLSPFPELHNLSLKFEFS